MKNPVTPFLKNSFLFLLISIFTAGCASSSKISENSFSDLQQKIDNRFNDSLFAHAHWGALIKSLKTGKVWYERNSNKMFMPASNEKILSGSAALVTLGPDFTFTTDLCYNGELADSVLKGDLIVFGNGDPTLYERFQKDSRDLFYSWADLLKSRGVTKITGNIIGDDNAFDDENLGGGWSFDGLDVWYSAEVGPLQLNEDYVDITVIPPSDKNGEVEIIPNLPSKYYNIVNNLTVIDTGRAHFNFSRAYGTNTIVFDGTVKAGSGKFVVSPSITNPTLFYVTVLKEALEEKGITVGGNSVDCDDIPNWNHKAEDFPILDVHHSPKLIDILTGMLKRSQNLYAETMPRILGWNETGLGSFGNGKKVVERVLRNFGVEPGTYQYVDGSGLSRYDYVSPEELVKILTGMYNSQYKQLWYNALPVAGVDGTLRNRMKGTKAEGNVHAKTGTISNVRGLSGYVKTAGGEELVFSFLVNGHLLSSKDTEDITDSVLELIADYQNNED